MTRPTIAALRAVDLHTVASTEVGDYYMTQAALGNDPGPDGVMAMSHRAFIRWASGTCDIVEAIQTGSMLP